MVLRVAGRTFQVDGPAYENAFTDFRAEHWRHKPRNVSHSVVDFASKSAV